MRHHPFIVIAPLVLWLFVACSDRSEAPQRPTALYLDCVKQQNQPEVKAPLHSKRGGKGTIRARLPEGTHVTKVRAMEGWHLVRVAGSKTIGWLESTHLGKCPVGSSQKQIELLEPPTGGKKSSSKAGVTKQETPDKAGTGADASPSGADAAALDAS